MDLFDSNGSFLGEGKEIFDSEGNLIGHFLESAKKGVEDAFEGSWILGIIFLLFIAPGWTLLGLVLFLIIKIIRIALFLAITIIKLVLIGLWWLVKLVARCLWWLLRLPVYLIFWRDIPEF